MRGSGGKSAFLAPDSEFPPPGSRKREPHLRQNRASDGLRAWQVVHGISIFAPHAVQKSESGRISAPQLGQSIGARFRGLVLRSPQTPPVFDLQAFNPPELADVIADQHQVQEQGMRRDL